MRNALIRVHSQLSEAFPDFKFTLGIAIYNDSDALSPLVWIEAVSAEPAESTSCECCGQFLGSKKTTCRVFIHDSMEKAIANISEQISSLNDIEKSGEEYASCV